MRTILRYWDWLIGEPTSHGTRVCGSILRSHNSHVCHLSGRRWQNCEKVKLVTTNRACSVNSIQPAELGPWTEVSDLLARRNWIEIISILSIEHVSIVSSGCSALCASGTGSPCDAHISDVSPERFVYVYVCACNNRITKEWKWMENCQQVIDLVARYRIQWTPWGVDDTRRKKIITRRSTEHRKSVTKIDDNDSDDDDNDDEFHDLRRTSTCSSFSRRFANCMHSIPASVSEAHPSAVSCCRSFCIVRMRIERNTKELAQRTHTHKNKIDAIMLFIQSHEHCSDTQFSLPFE